MPVEHVGVVADARCPQCGYRAILRAAPQCAECGSTAPPLQPLSRIEIRQALLRFLRWCLYGWSLLPLAVVIAGLAVAMNSLSLFILAGATVFAGSIATIILAVLVAIDQTPAALRVWWSLRDGECGPWSSGARYFLAWLMLFAFQVIIAILVGVIALLLFPGYPAGWP